MRTFFKYLLITIAALALLISWPAYQLYGELEKAGSEDPLVWEEAIAALERDTGHPPGAVLFMGSSSIRLWGTLAEDMTPFATINRGFGGAKLADAAHYAERLVAVEDPAAIVLFIGTNDIHPGASKEPKALLEVYQELIGKIRAIHPVAPIYYIAITPSLMRAEVWPEAQATNQLIGEYSAGQNKLYVIDTGAALMRDDAPNEDNYRWDGLHLSAAGYRIWTNIIRARLLKDLPQVTL